MGWVSHLSHSKPLLMRYFASILSGFPFKNFAWTSTVESVPSSSTKNIPVMSPSPLSASKTEGSLKTKDAVPEEPSRALVSLTSGTVGSFTPLINWMDDAIEKMVAPAEVLDHLVDWLVCC